MRKIITCAIALLIVPLVVQAGLLKEVAKVPERALEATATVVQDVATAPEAVVKDVVTAPAKVVGAVPEPKKEATEKPAEVVGQQEESVPVEGKGVVLSDELLK